VLGVLRDRIMSGRLAPGTRLVEAELAGQLGVSRLPVREALAQLEAVGFVRSIPGGRQVAVLSLRDFEQLFRLRLILETEAVQRAAQRHPVGECATLRAQLGQMRAALTSPDLELLSCLDMEMHQQIWEMADDRHLRRTLDLVIAPLFIYLARHAGQEDWTETLRWHEALAEHICRGDVQGAKESLAGHLEYSLTLARSMLSDEKEVEVDRSESKV
jgi:DNA-binding GntR family transcriptional regulator